MAIKREMIGQPLPPFVFEVERGKIREFAQAIGDPNPIYSDLAAAQAAGYPDLPIPPTFPTTFVNWGRRPDNAPPADLGFPHAATLHGEEEYTYLAPIYAGDSLTGQQTLMAVEDKQGRSGRMEIATLQTVYTNQRGEEVLRARSMLIVQHK